MIEQGWTSNLRTLSQNNARRIRILTLCSLLLYSAILASSGCRPTGRGDGEIQDAFTISVSTGGGFTGRVTGFHLHSDGKVEGWRRFPAQPDSILWAVKADSREIAEFAQRLERTGALKRVYRTTGNMTARIIYSTSDTSYTWSWSAWNQAPPELKEWYRRVTQFCRELRKKGQLRQEEGST